MNLNIHNTHSNNRHKTFFHNSNLENFLKIHPRINFTIFAQFGETFNLLQKCFNLYC